MITKVASFLLSLGLITAHAQDPAASAAPGMREVSPGIFELAKLRLDKHQHTVTFPGKVNLAEGALEYLLVTTEGSTHESLLVTEVQPVDLHFAMLLLGAKGAGLTTPAPDDAPPAQISKEYLQKAPKLKGDSLRISVKWKIGDVEKTTPVEDWLMNPETKKAVARGPWLYTGSMFVDGHFRAQSDGTFAALVTFPSALINNPREGNDNDLLWAVNHKVIPPAGTPVEIIILLEPAPDSKPAESK